MTSRLVFLSGGLAGLALLFYFAISALPQMGAGTSEYGARINRGSLAERRTQDAITAVNFDYRGFDTFGEELILFSSVIGSVVLLRQAREKHEELRPDYARGRVLPPQSEAVRAWTLAMTGPTVLFGLYFVTHGQVSPGGGFQGGAILATALLLFYLADGFKTFRRIAAYNLVEIGKSCGMLGFFLTGLLGFFAGKSFFENVLPLGKRGDVLSSGTIWLASAFTGLEVGAGLVLLVFAFLQETLLREEREEPS